MKKFDIDQMVFAIDRAERRVTDIIKRANEIANDSRKKERLKKYECRSCFYNPRIGGQAMTIENCIACREKQMYSNTSTDVLCLECAKKHKLCTNIAGETLKSGLDVGNGRKMKTKFISLQELRKPKHGHICYAGFWWLVYNGKAIILYDKYNDFPQCNKSKKVADYICKQASKYKWYGYIEVDLVWIEFAFIPVKNYEV